LGTFWLRLRKLQYIHLGILALTVLTQVAFCLPSVRQLILILEGLHTAPLIFLLQNSCIGSRVLESKLMPRRVNSITLQIWSSFAILKQLPSGVHLSCQGWHDLLYVSVSTVLFKMIVVPLADVSARLSVLANLMPLMEDIWVIFISRNTTAVLKM
jgi:hypothetical protein